MLSHWTRWQFAVPRVLTVIVALLAAQYGLGVAVCRYAARSGEAVIGGQIKIHHSRVSLLEGQVMMSSICVADPCDPTRYMAEADRCELNFATSSLLHKQVVVESGEITGLRFGTPRNAGDGPTAESNKAMASAARWFGEDAGGVAAKWFDRVSEQFRAGRISQLPSMELTEKLLTRSSFESTSLRERVQDLKRRSSEIQRQIEEAQSNRLRHGKFLETVPEELVSLNKEFDQLAAQIDQLPGTLEVERRAIVAARRNDEQFVRGQMQVEKVDSNSLSAYLLHEQAAAPLDEIIGCLRWARAMVPANTERQQSALAVARKGSRGEDVLFSGCTRRSGWLIRNLNLQGTTRIGGQPLELRGTLSEMAADQAFHSAPLRLKLATTGSLPLVLQATLDRSGGVARDELIVDCQGIVLPKQELGEVERLRLILTPSVGTLNASILLEGEKISGEIQLIQKEVAITPAMESQLSHAKLSVALQDTLDDVHSFATRLSVRGTLTEPTCTLWSNLGPAVAESMDRALLRASDKHCRELLQDAERRVDEQLAQLDRQLANSRSELLPQLAMLSARLEQIADQQSTPSRLSTEYLGRRLPSNSLFR